MNRPILLISEVIIRDEFGSSCCSTHSLKLLMIGLGECPVCHTLWRVSPAAEHGWERTVYWFCPEEIANGCAFQGTASCKTCHHATTEKYPSNFKISV